MLLIALRDLQWRRRRFIIGVIATGLVFALALLITGMASSFKNEVRRTVDSFGVDAWVVPEGSSGPFTGGSAFPASVADDVAADPGVEDASAMAMLRFTISEPSLEDINVIAVEIDGVGAPDVEDGRALQGTGEAIVDDSLSFDVGERITFGNREFEIVGTTHGLTYLAGIPAVFVSLADGQELALGGQPLATAVASIGTPQDTPPETRVMSNDEVIADLDRVLEQATQTIGFFRVLLWLVAAGIIGSVVYLQALERIRDFAVLKATGTTNGSLLGGLALQAVLLSLLSAIAAAVLSTLLAPLLAMPAEISGAAYALLPVVAVVVGLLASLAGLRRAVGVDPALAFGGA
jgi:putative ABC transport system permease protein